MKKILALLALTLTIVGLTGCLDPQDGESKDQPLQPQLVCNKYQFSSFVIKLTGYTKKPSLTAGFFAFGGKEYAPTACSDAYPVI